MRGPADPTSGGEPSRASALTLVQSHSPEVHKNKPDTRNPWEGPPDPGNKTAAKACQGQDGGEVVFLSTAAHHNSTGDFRASVPRIVVEPFAGRLFVTMLVMPDGTAERLTPFKDWFAADRQAQKLTRAFAGCMS